MEQRTFSRYEAFIIAILTIVQFTIILDFMVISPLGVILLKEMSITPAQFGMVVSAYAFSAGISGFLSAGFADKFDRKKMLLFFYAGFIFGTFLCGIATNYHFLLVARILTGVFGGVLGSIGFAIVTDLFRLEVRGRVMGFMQMAFASSQVLGIPVGLYLANEWGWHSAFLMIVGVSIPVWILIILRMHPVDAHLKLQSERNALSHLANTISRHQYIRAFAATILLATGGFMLMPFGTAFTVNNLGVDQKYLPMMYTIPGLFAVITGPWVGKLSDSIGKIQVFAAASLWTMIIVVIYCNLAITPLWIVILLNVFMFVGVSSRIISSQALISAVPDAKDRGAFMAVNSSIQYVSGGFATIVAGLIVKQQHSSAPMEHYNTLGYVVSCAIIITLVMMYFLDRYVQRKYKKQPQPAVHTEAGRSV